MNLTTLKNKSMIFTRIRLAFGLLLSLIFVHSSQAATVTYGFEAPQLTFGQTTPLLNVMPDIGPASFLANFTVPTGGSIGVNNLQINPLFSGQNLMDPGSPADTLRVTVNTPITDVHLDFALMAFSGHLRLQSSAGTVDANAVGQSGSLTFHGATSFTQFDLLGLTSSNTGTLLAIDNLTMTLVPEPSSVFLLVATASMVLLRRCRRIRGCA